MRETREPNDEREKKGKDDTVRREEKKQSKFQAKCARGKFHLKKQLVF